MLTLIFGIPGIGKTTVLEELQKIYPEIHVVKLGTILFKIAEQKSQLTNRDEIRKLDIQTQKENQFEAAEHINGLLKEHGKLIVDTHAAVKTTTGYIPGFNEELLRTMNPNNYVLIECEPELILRRRLADPTRNRDDDSLEIIKQHQMIDRSFAATYATMTNGMILIVENKEGQPEYAAQKIAEIL